MTDRKRPRYGDGPLKECSDCHGYYHPGEYSRHTLDARWHVTRRARDSRPTDQQEG